MTLVEKILAGDDIRKSIEEEIITTNVSGNWKQGVVKVRNKIYTFVVKSFDKGSIYGINDGRISKLEICDEAGDRLVSYDRGWEIEPGKHRDTDLMQVYNQLLDKYN